MRDCGVEGSQCVFIVCTGVSVHISETQATRFCVVCVPEKGRDAFAPSPSG